MERGPKTHLELSRALRVPKNVVQARFVYLKNKKFVEKVRQNPPCLWKAAVPRIPTFLKAKSDGSFYNSPSFSLAYVLGVCYGDACVIKYWDNVTGVYRHVISLEVPEIELAAEFRSALEKIGLNPSFSFYSKKKTYRVRAYSTQFYGWFKQLTSRDLKGMLRPTLFAPFIRGFYESKRILRV